LYNEIVENLKESGDKFPAVMTNKAIGDHIVAPITNAIWYLSGNMMTIQERSQHLTDVKAIPNRY
jgi:hypothetical protein